jgi:hypothetical protein
MGNGSVGPNLPLFPGQEIVEFILIDDLVNKFMLIGNAGTKCVVFYFVKRYPQ